MRTTSACLSLLLATLVPAQVYVVDVNNGPGTDFTSLPAAVAQVPDGATLHVRPGTYSGFSLTSRGLRIFGEGSVTLQGAVAITATGTQQLVFVRGVTFAADVDLNSCNGPVVLDRCNDTLAFFPVRLRATGCRMVWMDQCSLTQQGLVTGTSGDRVMAVDSELMLSRSSLLGSEGTAASFSIPGGPGTAALSLVRSRCLGHENFLTGGRGGMGCRSCGLPGCAADGGPGGPACRIDASSTLFVFGGQVTGGTGGYGACCPFGGCEDPGDGGPGILFAGGTAQFFGSAPLGGAAGTGGTGLAAPGTPTAGVGSLNVDGSARPSTGWIDGSQTRNGIITFGLQAAPLSPALLMLSYRQEVLPLEPLGHGALLAFPALFAGPFAVDGTGLLSLPLTLPASLPLGEVYAGQFLTLEPGPNTIWVSNPFSLAVDH